jgi:very-short-patch-repair endonuclease
MHYKRWQAHGDTTKAKPGRKPGIPLTEEHRQHIAEGLARAVAEGKGRKPPRDFHLSESHRQALLKSITGRPSSMKGKTVPPEKRGGQKGQHRSLETKRLIGEAAKRLWEDPAHREVVSASSKKCWRDPEYREKGLAALANIHGPTSIEISVAETLRARGIEFEQQKVIGPFICDIFVASLNLDIECDGDYWHSLPNMKKRDRMRDSWFWRNGYRVLRLTEREIRADVGQAIAAGLDRIVV